MRVRCSMTIAMAIGVGTTSAAAIQGAGREVPGYYRMVLGDFTIIALNDGVVGYRTAQLLPTAPADRIAASLRQAGLTEPWGMSYNGYLIDTGEKRILIDTGTGGTLADSPFFAGAGRLLANLEAAGYRPEQVDEIYITHLGPDHVGGLSRGGRRVFPNAILRAAQREVDVFLAPGVIEANPNDWRLPYWRDLFQPWIAAGRFRPFEDDGPLAPGIRAVATPGHTPGHTSYLVESRGAQLLVLGDVILVGAMQFEDPALPSSFDVDRSAGIAQRQRMLEEAAKGDWLVAGAHLSFPGLGRVRTAPPGYRWVPVNYAIPVAPPRPPGTK
jgi:glyoxylase-like metal-dependent hydrolase (beta-lactamase superfamily II)